MVESKTETNDLHIKKTDALIARPLHLHTLLKPMLIFMWRLHCIPSTIKYCCDVVNVIYFLFSRETRLSPYAVSTHTKSNSQLKRPKSAVLSQKGRSKRNTGPPQTVIGWADKADWAVTDERPKQRNRPVSAPATRNR